MFKHLNLVLFILSINYAQADCNSFLSTKLEEMNMGKLSNPSCGVIKNVSESKIRVSMSTTQGKNDHGPTVTFYNGDPDNLKIVQLFSKDKLTKHRHRYQYILSNDCEEIKSVTYTLGNLQSDINQEKCNDIDSNFQAVEKVNLGILKICETYFPKLIETTAETIENSGTVVVD